MRIGLDVSPLSNKNFLQHRVRGTGIYTENLQFSLKNYFPENEYAYFSRGEKIPFPADVIHFPYFEPFFLTLPFRRKLVPTVVTVHDLTPLVFSKFFPIGLRGNIKWFIQKRILRRVDAIITDSESSKKDIINIAQIPNDKIHVVYLAASKIFRNLQITNQQKNYLRGKYNLPEKFVLYVGDITWNKNLPRIVQAIQKTSISLVMVGKAITEKTFNKTNTWNQDRIIVQKFAEGCSQIYRIGFVSDEDLIKLYNLATLLVMPSLYEGFGLPILEAMSCGCPVITSKAGSLEEVAGNAAYFVDPYNVNNIAENITKVFESTSLQKKLSELGFEHAKKFSWKKTATKTIDVYRKIAS